MANTTNLDLVKPLGTDRALISVINGNMDKIDAYAGKTDDSLDAIQQSIAIVSVGDTHAAIASGQYVYVKGHNTLNEGLYTASSTIAENAALSLSNLTSGSDALNTIESQISTLDGNKVNTSDIANNLTTTASGKVLDARQGKELKDAIEATAITTIEKQEEAVTINAYQAYRIGKLVVVNVRFTTSSSISSGKSLIKGLPWIETSLATGNSFGGVATNKSDAQLSLLNVNAYETAAIATSATLAAGTYCATCIYFAQ